MPDGKSQQPEQQEVTTLIEQKETSANAPSIGPAQLHEYRDKTKEAGKKSADNATNKNEQLRSVISPEQ